MSSKLRSAHESAIGREWDSWAAKNDKPLLAASGRDAFSFFNFLQTERLGILTFTDNINTKWRIVEKYLKATGRVGI